MIPVFPPYSSVLFPGGVTQIRYINSGSRVIGLKDGKLVESRVVYSAVSCLSDDPVKNQGGVRVLNKDGVYEPFEKFAQGLSVPQVEAHNGLVREEETHIIPEKLIPALSILSISEIRMDGLYASKDIHFKLSSIEEMEMMSEICRETGIEFRRLDNLDAAIPKSVCGLNVTNLFFDWKKLPDYFRSGVLKFLEDHNRYIFSPFSSLMMYGFASMVFTAPGVKRKEENRLRGAEVWAEDKFARDSGTGCNKPGVSLITETGVSLITETGNLVYVLDNQVFIAEAGFPGE